jgi:hypothetical protein
MWSLALQTVEALAVQPSQKVTGPEKVSSVKGTCNEQDYRKLCQCEG